MKGMIFAAGLGSRLSPLTDKIPKPLIEIDGMPLLEHIIRKMISVGITSIAVNVHHLSHKIVGFLRDKDFFGINTYISHEKERLLDTGGGISNCIKFLYGPEPVVVYNADIYSEFPLSDMIGVHLTSKNDVTLLTSERNTSRKLIFDNTGRMRGWIKNGGEEMRPADLDMKDMKPFAFGGVHIINPSVLFSLERYARQRGEVFSITDFYVENCNMVKIGLYEQKDKYFWFDIGKPDILKKLTGMTIDEYLRRFA